MKKTVLMIGSVMMLMMLFGCGGDKARNKDSDKNGSGRTISEENSSAAQIEVTVNDTVFQAELADNDAAEAFAEMLKDGPVTIDMRDFSGFEKVGALGRELPADDRDMTTESGDIVLYNENQIVMFYGSNTWSYTMLGKVSDLSGWKEALGSGDVKVTFSVQ